MHRRRRHDGGTEEDRNAMVEARAWVERTNSLEATSRPRAAIWFSTSNDRGMLRGTPFPGLEASLR